MSTQKKFGTFSGVLTPSLLTILGVIMYMRLGSVVGYSSSIFQVVLIIVFSHLISVTTGLSVSSIATDKKIDKGGIYYMLTRSLGLPIGGAIGLTIFFATALSIALYLIGFSESLIPVLNDAFGIGKITVNKLRLIGTIALLIVLAVAYISTSFALKIQYVILALIVLSLGSIFLGSAKGLTVGNDQISSPNFAILFGIFFPAVTGFTAGVAMSGDLKSPRISIPWGTMLSITIGLVVYLSLAFFIYYNIDSEILKTNNNVLIEFGAIPLLVLGGVWGATLSSALGGILGGPRILQAMSLDLITPKIFAKGHGVNNEPRNALLLTFIIAEMGILIGELNVIAELVAMFYMAAYLFINISCFLEQWSSPDFRPKFKIPIAVSLIGAIATFLLMIQLNLAATLVAVIVMMAFWFWLSKKDLVLGTGDVWFSVWTSIVKTALKNLQKKSVHKRNWQPNILLFSGGTKNRPHLIEFSKSIMGRGGMVSNFDLIEVDSATTLFPKSHQIVKDEEIVDDTIFHRKLYCQNIFKGIETIANTYGFTGVDPNTILMGWARNTKDPKWFGEMTNKLKDLDYNILFLDYDQDRGFGKYAEINIWWTEFNKQNELGLQMVKFLRNSPWWKSANLKIYFVNNTEKENKQIEEIIQLMLDKKRMRADVVVIDNTLDQKDVNDHIKTRSHNADLILMDLPLLEKDKENDFIEASNLLFTTIGSALFIEASSAFEISDTKMLKSDLENIKPRTSKLKSLSKIKPELIKSHDAKLDDKLGILQSELLEFNQHLSSNISDALDELTIYYQQILDSDDHSSDTIYQLYDSEYILKLSEEITDQLGILMDDYYAKTLSLINRQDKYIWFELSPHFINEKYISAIENGYLQKYHSPLNSGKIVRVKIPFKRLLIHWYKSNFINELLSNLDLVGIINLNFLNQFKNKTKDKKVSLMKTRDDALLAFQVEMDKSVTKLINAISMDVAKGDLRSLIENREEEFSPKSYQRKIDEIDDFSYWFGKNIFILHNHKIFQIGNVILNEFSMANIDLVFHNLKRELEVNYKARIEKINAYSLRTVKNLSKIITSFEDALAYTNRAIQPLVSKVETRSLVEKFPSEIDLYPLDSISSFKEKQTNLVEKTFYLNSTLNSIYQKEIALKIKSISAENSTWLKDNTEDLINNFKLLVFTLENQDNKKLVIEVKDKLKEKIKDFKNNISSFIERVEVQREELNKTATLFLNENYIFKNSSRREVKSITNENLISNKIKNSQTYFSVQINKILDRFSKEDSDSFIIGKSERLLRIKDFIKSVSIDASLHKGNAQTYIQLFNTLAQPNQLYDSFIGKHLELLKEVAQNHTELNENIVMVSGDPSSGKSYLINSFIKTQKQQTCFTMYSKNEILQLKTDFNSIQLIDSNNQFVQLNDIKSGSVVVINDLELYWKKTNDGLKQINLLLTLINSYPKILFVIECNILLLSLLNECTDLGKDVISYIQTASFSSDNIEKVLVEKNKISGKSIHLKGDQFKFGTFGKFQVNAKKLESLSGGNIGWLNTIWMSFLSYDESGEIELNPNYESYFPDVFSDEDLQILLQLYWHKKLSLGSFNLFFHHWGEDRVNQVLGFLKNQNLITSLDDYFEINKVILPYLKTFFINKNYII